MATFDQENKKAEKILIKKAHKMAGRKERVIELNAAVLSVYGWQMAIPMVLGVILGRLLDHFIPMTYLSWTLNFILIGAVIGFYNATRWIKREGSLSNKKKGKQK
ncbi:MAG: AtpZ/AtpI family protein [Alphaproteobacteria bacterium]|nr:AtpZ/AtpI family protein [Alphaproteobacteria bacterium]